MKRFGNYYVAVAVMSLIILGSAGLADAQRRNERQIRNLVRTLNAQIDDFQFGLNYQMRSSSSRTPDVENVEDSIRNLQSTLDDFEENLNNARENRDDVRAIITAAKDIDVFLAQNPQDRRVEATWQSVRTTINSLASNYGVIPDWSTRISATPGVTRDRAGNTVQPRVASSHVLTGTYQLDAGRSENIGDIVAGTGLAGNQRQELQARLEAPTQIAIDIRGTQVTLASSKASPVNFVADGREKTEQVAGRTVRLRATLRGEELTITSLGGETDYIVTFSALDSGRTMKVTRRITADYLNETVFAESIYTKTDTFAGLGIDGNSPGTYSDNVDFSSSDPNDRNDPNPTFSQTRTGQFIVPGGTIITGLLDTSIDTKVTQNNDRFRMTVQSPNEFRGAVIEGYLTGVGRSGQVSGRSNVTFNFETITLRSGQRYDFAGYLQSVKDQNGKEVRVDAEGTAKSDSQTKETAKRGGIGAGLGAIIGAIAGGGKGAAIGAIIGGSAGAGSVIVQGREDLQLMKGSIITVQSSTPGGPARRVARDNE